MQQPANRARIWGLPKNVFFLGFVSLLTDLSSEVAIRTLPLFLANVLGIKASIIGLIEGIADSTATLTRLLSGWLSDRLGKRKVLVTAGYGLSTFVKCCATNLDHQHRITPLPPKRRSGFYDHDEMLEPELQENL